MAEIVLPDRKFTSGEKVFLFAGAFVISLLLIGAAAFFWLVSRLPPYTEAHNRAFHAEALVKSFVRIHQGRAGARFEIDGPRAYKIPSQVDVHREYSLKVTHENFNFTLGWGGGIGGNLAKVLRPCDGGCGIYKIEGNPPPLTVIDAWIKDMDATICERSQSRYPQCKDAKSYRTMALTMPNDQSYLIVFRE